MIEKIIQYSMTNRVIVLVMVILLSAWGFWGMTNSPMDALPDLSDVQVIVFTEWMGRSPDLVEDQITYPITSTLLSAPGIKFVRGQSMFGMSFVYAVFEDGTDMYWARSRVLEYLNQVQGDLPDDATPVLGPDATGVGWVFQYTLSDTTGQQNLSDLPDDATPVLGPDATGVGWVFQYTLSDTTGQQNLSDLRTFNDWYLRYWLESLPGVAQVATVGGYVKQYQVIVDPIKLLAYDIPLTMVMHAIQESNEDVGGRTIEMAGTEVMVRGQGYIESVEEIENIVVMQRENRPVLVSDLAVVEIGGDQRRGIAEWNGQGEAVGGIVVMRYGENALNVIDRVKTRIAEIEPSLPDGVTLEIAYDRSELIRDAIGTLSDVLTKEMIIVLLIVGLFLLHFRSSLVVILTLPVAVLISFIPVYMMGLTVNVMSLGGIAIAIGAMVDASVVLVENAHKRLEQWADNGRPGSRIQVIIDATKEVGRPIFFALLIITISFLPVFALEAQEGRLFKPLAYTKTFAMLVAALLSITFSAALIAWLVKGNIVSEKNHPVSRFFHRLYLPVVNWALTYRWITVTLAVMAIILTIPVYNQLGSEFMPPLEEGSILYMPTTPPGMSIAEAQYMLNIQGQILSSFPEVKSVQGKAGRADTPTDPAPLNMFETTVMLENPSEWRSVQQQRWYSSWMPEAIKPPFHWVWPEERLISWDELIAEMDAALRIPGMPNIWWMPVQTRTEMLATGVRSALAVKVLGPDLASIEHTSVMIERLLRNQTGTRSAFAERPTGGYYLDIKPDREMAAQYGLTTGDINTIIEMAVGGMNITNTVEGRERYPVNIRYGRELRQDLDDIRRTFVPAPDGSQIPLGMLASFEYVDGPPMIATEAGQLRNLVHVDVAGRDIGSYVEEARERIEENIDLPPGVRIEFAGQFQYMQRVQDRLRILVPITLGIIFLLLYLNFRSLSRTLLVLLSIPFALVGSFLMVWWLDFNMSIAVWVGIIALAGVSAEIGVVLIHYLDQSVKERIQNGKMNSMADLMQAVIDGTVQRLRPILMTVTTTVAALIPIMFTSGVGAMAMQRIAAPLIGGLVTATFLTLLIIPAVYLIWQQQLLMND